MVVHAFVGPYGGVVIHGIASISRAFNFVSSGGMTFTGGHAETLREVLITEVPYRGRFLLHMKSVDIPCIKTSRNIIENNDGQQSVSCFIQADRRRMPLNLTPENDPFFFLDNDKRVYENTLVTFDGEMLGLLE